MAMSKAQEEQLVALLKKQEEITKNISTLQTKINNATEDDTKELIKQKDIEQARLKNIKETIEKIENEEKLHSKINKLLSGQNEEHQTALQRLKEINKEIEHNNEKYQKTGKILQSAYDSLRHTKDAFKEVYNIDSTALDFKEHLKRAKTIETTAKHLGYRMGEGEEGAKKLAKAMNEVQLKFKDSYQNATAITTALSETGYVENIEEAAAGMSLFTRATGANIGVTTNLLNSLTKVGKFSSKESNTVLANIAKIQQKNGITKSGMDALVNSIGRATANMKAFGQSEESIKRMTIETAKLVSGMEKVGVTAETALGWVEKLTDPEKIEENIGLYAQLGMSISDALSGEINSDQIAEGMKEFGQKLKDMGPIAGKAYAEAFNVSYKEAIKAADYETPDFKIEDETKEDESIEALTQLREATLSSVDKVQDMFHQISGGMQNVGEVWLFAADGIQFAMANAGITITSAIDSLINALSVKGYGDEIRNELNKAIEVSAEQLSQTEAQIGEIEELYDEMCKNNSEGLEDIYEWLQEYEKEADYIKQNLKNTLAEAEEILGNKVPKSWKRAIQEQIDNVDSVLKKDGRITSESLKKSLEQGGRNVKSSIQTANTSGSNKMKNAHIIGASKGAEKIERAHLAGAAKIGGKIGAIVGIVGTVGRFAGSVVNAFNPEGLEVNNPVLKFMANSIGINTKSSAELTKAITDNTDALNENSDNLNNKNAPAQIFRQDNGQVAIAYSGNMAQPATTTSTTTNNNTTVVQNQSTNNVTTATNGVKEEQYRTNIELREIKEIIYEWKRNSSASLANSTDKNGPSASAANPDQPLFS